MAIPGAAFSDQHPAYERVGRGPALVLIHGLGADRHVWSPVIPRLALERDVIAVDLPGFGASPCLPPGVVPRPAALAGEVARLVRALLPADRRAHIGGNSLGGWVAFELALTGHAESVTAIAPAGLWERPLGPRRRGRAPRRAPSPPSPASRCMCQGSAPVR